MAEAWERVYAKFYWLIIIVVVATMFWLVLSDAIRQGSLHTLLTTALKFIAFYLAIVLFVRIIPLKWKTQLKNWRTKRRLNEFLVSFLSYAFAMVGCYFLFGWRLKLEQVLDVVMVGSISSLMTAFFSDDEGHSLPPDTTDASPEHITSER